MFFLSWLNLVLAEFDILQVKNVLYIFLNFDGK